MERIIKRGDGGPQSFHDGDVARVPCAPGRGGGVRVGSVRGGVGSAVHSCAGALGGAILVIAAWWTLLLTVGAWFHVEIGGTLD